MALQVLNGPIIEAGESLSAPMDVSMGELVRITMPPEWNNAELTFQFSSDGVTFNDMFHLNGFEVEISKVVPDVAVIIPAHVGRAIGYIKFRSGSRAKPIPQEATRNFRMTIDNKQDPKPSPNSPYLMFRMYEIG